MSTSLAYITQDLEPQLPLLTGEILVDTQTQVQREVQTNLKHEIHTVTSQIADPYLREISQTILGEMRRFFNWLARIENNLQKLDTLLESLSLLEVLEFESRSLTDYIDTRAIKLAAGNEKLHEVLDGISYGITHDLRRIFERELVRGVTEQSIPIVYGKILHAHGLLTNCFQQSTITLLQVFKPNLDASTLFNDVELRLQQSLILCKDLSSLMRFVRLAQANGDPDVLRSVTARILEFRDGSMQYLMYKDWRGYESLALEVITAVENNLDSKPLLHRFICYLEVLYGHVKMRAVLADEFPYSGGDQEV
jgi:ubiquinone biosynthesis protein UbiJ